jgi:hypothetical protein
MPSGAESPEALSEFTARLNPCPSRTEFSHTL